jgi:hypothetical protein
MDAYDGTTSCASGPNPSVTTAEIHHTVGAVVRPGARRSEKMTLTVYNTIVVG